MSIHNHVEAMDWIQQQQQPRQQQYQNDATAASATQENPTTDNIGSPSPSRSKTATSNLKNETVFKLVNHSVGAIALDCGYHVAHQSCLDILNDVCCDYFKKIATLLRLAHDTEEWRDNDSDFVDSLERVFHQVNIPSTANLHQFICKMEAFKRHQQQNNAPQSSSSSTIPACNSTSNNK